MANKSERRRKARAEKRQAKSHAMKSPGFESNYAKKAQWLAANGGWGFEHGEPKPWKS